MGAAGGRRRRSRSTSGWRTPRAFLGPSWLRLPMLLLGRLPGSTSLPRTLWQLAVRPAADAAPIVRRPAARRTGPASGSTLVVLGSSASTSPTSATGTSSRSCRSCSTTRRTTASCTCSTGRCSSATTRRRCCTTVLGTGFAAHVLSYVYLWFLPLVPLALTAWLVWSRNMPTATGSPPRSASPGRSARCPTTRCRRSARPEYPCSTPTSPTPRRPTLMDSLSNTRRPGDRSSGVEGVGAVGRRLRQPALRDHPAGGADGAVHAAQPGR